MVGGQPPRGGDIWLRICAIGRRWRAKVYQPGPSKAPPPPPSYFPPRAFALRLVRGLGGAPAYPSMVGGAPHFTNRAAVALRLPLRPPSSLLESATSSRTQGKEAPLEKKGGSEKEEEEAEEDGALFVVPQLWDAAAPRGKGFTIEVPRRASLSIYPHTQTTNRAIAHNHTSTHSTPAPAFAQVWARGAAVSLEPAGEAPPRVNQKCGGASEAADSTGGALGDVFGDVFRDDFSGGSEMEAKSMAFGGTGPAAGGGRKKTKKKKGPAFVADMYASLDI